MEEVIERSKAVKSTHYIKWTTFERKYQLRKDLLRNILKIVVNAVVGLLRGCLSTYLSLKISLENRHLTLWSKVWNKVVIFYFKDFGVRQTLKINKSLKQLIRFVTKIPNSIILSFSLPGYYENKWKNTFINDLF